MLTGNEKKSLMRLLVAGSCSALITVAVFTAGASAETISISFQPATDNIQFNPTTTVNTKVHGTPSTSGNGEGNCLYSAQLSSDPALKNAYNTKLAVTKWGLKEESDEEIYESNIEVGNTFAARLAGNNNGIDSLSTDCLSCHDGVMAQNFNIRIKNNPNNRVMGLEDIIGGHPVGMEYERYLNVNGKEYRSDVKYNNDVIFAEGKVGCLTCHNPLNKSKGHLVMNNDRSELCFSCHSK